MVTMQRKLFTQMKTMIQVHVCLAVHFLFYENVKISNVHEFKMLGN